MVNQLAKRKKKIRATRSKPGRGKIWVKPNKKKKKSNSYRRESHHRDGTTVTTSKKVYHRGHARRKRRTQAEINTVVKKAKRMSLAQKRDLPLRDRRMLQRRGLL